MKKKRLPGGILPGDMVIFLIVAAIAVFLLLAERIPKPTSAAVEIRTDTETVLYSLASDAEIPVNSRGYSLCVEIRNGSVCVFSSDCENQICVNTGSVSRVGQCIVCAPAHVVIRITGGGGGDADWILS